MKLRLKKRKEFLNFLFSKNKPYKINERFTNSIRAEYFRYKNIMEKRDVSTIHKLPSEKKDHLVLPRLVISVSNKCSLKCESCNALIPYFDSKRDIPVNDLIDDINKIFRGGDCCITVEVIGGEPFLYKDLHLLLEYLINMKQIFMIEITTNGTIVPRNDMVSILQNEKVFVPISDYGNINLEKKKEVIHFLDTNHINYEIIEADYWFDSGNIEKRNKFRKVLEWNKYNCDANWVCKTLWDGKLFTCGRAPALFELGKLSDNSSYIAIDTIFAAKSPKQELLKYYLLPYGECCDHCDYADVGVKHIEKGIQLKFRD